MGRADIKPLPSQERLRELFAYDPETGALSWRSNPKFKGRAGGQCGTVGDHGYLKIGIERRYYLAQRIIWKWMTGEEPSECVDHEDLDRLNNRWSNLRSATNGQNKQNGRIYKNNTSGIKGVCWDEFHKSWVAYVSADGKQMRIGRFKELNVAASAVTNARSRLHGEFARAA